MQNFTSIEATVAEISVTGKRKTRNQCILPVSYSATFRLAANKTRRLVVSSLAMKTVQDCLESVDAVCRPFVKHWQTSRVMSDENTFILAEFFSGGRGVSITCVVSHWACFAHKVFNPLKGRGNYIATSNNMKLVHWPLMGGLVYWIRVLFDDTSM